MKSKTKKPILILLTSLAIVNFSAQEKLTQYIDPLIGIAKFSLRAQHEQ